MLTPKELSSDPNAPNVEHSSASFSSVLSNCTAYAQQLPVCPGGRSPAGPRLPYISPYVLPTYFPPGTVHAFAKLESMHPSIPSYFLRCLNVLLGRSSPQEPCDIDVSAIEPRVLPKHVTIQYHFGNQTFELTMHAQEGVCINNQPIEKNMTVPLKHSTRISIGVIRFLFLLPQPTNPDEVYRSYITSEEDLPEPPPFELMIRETLYQHQGTQGMTLKDLCRAMIQKYPQTRLHCGWQHAIRKLLQKDFKVLGSALGSAGGKEELWGLP